MRSVPKSLVLFAALAPTGLPAMAQQNVEKSAAVYRIEFAIHDAGGHNAVKTWHYKLLLENGGSGAIRAGHRVALSAPGVEVKNHPLGTYMDVGLIIDCKLREDHDQVRLNAEVEISSLPSSPSAPKMVGGILPSIKNIRSLVATALQPGQPTIIASLEDPATSHRYEIEVNAVRVR